MNYKNITLGIALILALLYCFFSIIIQLRVYSKPRIQFTALQDSKSIALDNTNYSINIRENSLEERNITSYEQSVTLLNNSTLTETKLPSNTYAYSLISLNNKNYLVVRYPGVNNGDLNYQLANITTNDPGIIAEMISSCWDPYLINDKLTFDKISNNYCDDLILKDETSVTFDL